MIIILNDDPVYVAWLRRHRTGFVLDTKRKATQRNTMLHRARCDQIRKAKSKRTRWTTGKRVKACAELRDELIEWAREQIGGEPQFCSVCEPTDDDWPAASRPDRGVAKRSLTKLENDIVSAVVESAVIHLDNDLAYCMTVGDVARYLSKTPGQITAAVQRLMSLQMLDIERGPASGSLLAPELLVLPTVNSLRTVPAFARMGSDQLQSELATLRG